MKARIPGAQGGRQAMIERLQQMQADLEAKQQEVEETEYSASAGGGAVEAIVTGAKTVVDIKINPEVVDPEDVEMLQDMIIAAVNEALRKADDAMNSVIESTKGGLGGLNIPGLV